jgi:hypothetical protein
LTLPATVAVTVTEQLPDDSVQVVEENVTPPFPEACDHVTVPLCDEYPPDTVAAQVTFEPTPMDDCEHAVATAVDALLTVSEAVWELA